MLGLEKVMRARKSICAQVGCTSITAARAGQVTACDIDPQAVESTESNWELNQLDIPFQAFTNDFTS